MYDRLLLLWNNTLHLTWIQKLTELLNITSAICINTVFLLVIICNNWCLELYLLLFSGSFVILLLLPFLVLSISVCGFLFNRSHTCWCDVNNYIKNKLSYSYALWILALFMQTKYLDRFCRAVKSSLSLLYIYQRNDVIILLAILKKKLPFLQQVFVFYSSSSCCLQLFILSLSHASTLSQSPQSVIRLL